MRSKLMQVVIATIFGTLTAITLPAIVIGLGPDTINTIRNLTTAIKGNALNAVITLAIVYFVLRLATRALAAREFLFTSPGLGRIKAITKNGKIVAYFAHLKGLTGELPNADPDKPPYVGAVHINENTGEIVDGEEQIWSLWWILFGVRFIGLNDVLYYEIRVRTVGTDGKIVETAVIARSLHFTNICPMRVEDRETKTGERGDLDFTITLQTTHAGESLKYRGAFLGVVIPPAEAVAKDYVSSRDVKAMITDKSELSQEASGFVQSMRLLNDDRVGNTSLHKRVGQRVIAANLTDVQFEEAVAKALEAKQIAITTGEAEVETARLKANADIEKARGERAIRQVEVDMLKETISALEKPGGKLAADIEKLRHLRKGMEGFQGNSLGLGGSVISNLPLDGEKKATT